MACFWISYRWMSFLHYALILSLLFSRVIWVVNNVNKFLFLLDFQCNVQVSSSQLWAMFAASEWRRKPLPGFPQLHSLYGHASNYNMIPIWSQQKPHLLQGFYFIPYMATTLPKYSFSHKESGVTFNSIWASFKSTCAQWLQCRARQRKRCSFHIQYILVVDDHKP